MDKAGTKRTCPDSSVAVDTAFIRTLFQRLENESAIERERSDMAYERTQMAKEREDFQKEREKAAVELKRANDEIQSVTTILAKVRRIRERAENKVKFLKDEQDKLEADKMVVKGVLKKIARKTIERMEMLAKAIDGEWPLIDDIFSDEDDTAGLDPDN